MHTDKRELFAQVLAFALIAFIFLYATSQLITPYISHDDWDFLVPASWGLDYSTPWDKTLSEGRWLSYLWSLVSAHLTPETSYLIFISGYFLLTCSITLHATKPRAFALCGLAMFFSPMFGLLSLWPTGMTCSILLSCVATWLVAWKGERFATLIVFVATLSLVLTYPPLAVIVLMAAAMKKADAPWRQKALLGSAYIVGFAAGTLAIYSLNLVFHGHFGLKIDAWRASHTPHGLSGLLANATLYLAYWNELLRSYTTALIFSIVATIMLLCQPKARNFVTAILLATMLVCGIELGITLITGTSIPARSAVWLWVVACLLSASVANYPLRTYRYVGLIFLLTLAITGASDWWSRYARVQPIPQYKAQMAKMIRQYQAKTDSHTVIMVGDPSRIPELQADDALNVTQAFQMSMRKRFGIHAERCSIEFCSDARQYMNSHKRKTPTLLLIDGKLAIVFAADGHGIFYERNYPSVTQESKLGLGYSPFVPYGPNSVRVTPFFPGKSVRPLSIKLAPTRTGYRMQLEGTACAYSLKYSLSSSDGKPLADGMLKSSDIVALPPWNESAGTAIFSLRMADGAKNNYACNLMITKD